MADITKIQIESGIYNIKDETARKMARGGFEGRRFILIGDSYGNGYTTDGYITGWPAYFKSHNNLSNENCIINCDDGAGFGGSTTASKDFYALINELTNDEEVTDVVICGGINDINFTYQQIQTGISNCKTLVDTKFPNATIHIGMIASSMNSPDKKKIYNTLVAYTELATGYNIEYLTNVEYILKNGFGFMTAIGIHPNTAGQQQLARYITEAVEDGSCDIVYSYQDIVYTLSSIWDGIRDRSLGSIMNNNTVSLMKGVKTSITSTNGNSLACDGTHGIELGTITSGYINGDNDGYTVIPTHFILYDGVNFKQSQGFIKIINNIIYAYPQLIESNVFPTVLIKEIQILPYHATFDSILC